MLLMPNCTFSHAINYTYRPAHYSTSPDSAAHDPSILDVPVGSLGCAMTWVSCLERTDPEVAKSVITIHSVYTIKGPGLC